MPQLAQNITSASPGSAGPLFVSPKGTALPTDESTTLNAAFKVLGFLGDSGLEPSGDAPSLNDIKAFGGDTVATLVEDKGTRKFTVTLLEYFNADANKLLYGATNVTVTAATSSAGTKLAIQDKGDLVTPSIYVAELQYQGKKIRRVIPNGQLVVTQERPMVHTDVMGYECEISCLPDANGVRIYNYLANDDKTA